MKQRTMRRRHLSLSALGLATAGLLLIAPTTAHAAASTAIDFDDFELGSPGGQNGWTAAGDYDWAIVGTPGDQSLRFSNGKGNYGNITQLKSPQIDPAGEISTGAAVNTFETSFTVASSTGGYQPGLNIEVSIDDGSGARSGGVINLRHVEEAGVEGLQVSTRWPAGPADPGDWRSDAHFVPGFDTHTIGYKVVFVNDDFDVAEISVDGAKVLTGGSYEEYHDSIPAPKQVANSLLFRASVQGPTEDGIGYVPWNSTELAPTPEQKEDLLGEGFLFDDVSYRTFHTLPASAPTVDPEPDPSPDETLETDKAKIQPGDKIVVTGSGFDPYEDVHLTWYSTPIFAGWTQADAGGNINITLTVPAGLASGIHTIQAVGASSGVVANTQLTVLALAATGPETAIPFAALGGAFLLLGAVVIGAVGVRRRVAGRS